MEDIFGIGLEGSLAPGAQDAPSMPELAGLIPMLLEGGSDEVLEELYGDRARRMPGRKASAEAAMGAIPHEYSEVITANPPVAKGARRDGRKRPARPRKKRKKPERQRPAGIGSAQLDKIRKGFIAIIKRIVNFAATEYRRLLTQPGAMPATTPSNKIRAAQMDRCGKKSTAKMRLQ